MAFVKLKKPKRYETIISYFEAKNITDPLGVQSQLLRVYLSCRADRILKQKENLTVLSSGVFVLTVDRDILGHREVYKESFADLGLAIAKMGQYRDLYPPSPPG